MPDLRPATQRRPERVDLPVPRAPAPASGGEFDTPGSGAPRWVLHYRVASEVKALPTEFLWDPYIPKGAITMIAGKGGMGKSTIICKLAADLSAGRKLQGARRALLPQKVMIISAEDDIERRLVPTLELMGATLENIALSDSTFLLDEDHMVGLGAAIEQFGATVIFLDPVVSYLGGEMDINQSNQVREMMDNLDRAAKRSDRAVIVVHHHRKDTGNNPGVEAALGSADFGNKARSAVVVWKDKLGQRYLKHVKHNWSRQGDTIEYSLETVKHTNGTEYSQVAWGMAFADDSEVEEGLPQPKVERVTDKARAWLFGLLRDGPRLFKEIAARAETDGISMKACERVKPGMINSRKTLEGWVWELAEREGMGDLPEPLPLAVSPMPQIKPGLDLDVLEGALKAMRARDG